MFALRLQQKANKEKASEPGRACAAWIFSLKNQLVAESQDFINIHLRNAKLLDNLFLVMFENRKMSNCIIFDSCVRATHSRAFADDTRQSLPLIVISRTKQHFTVF